LDYIKRKNNQKLTNIDWKNFNRLETVKSKKVLTSESKNCGFNQNLGCRKFGNEMVMDAGKEFSQN
jgi:hypothetical protein